MSNTLGRRSFLRKTLQVSATVGAMGISAGSGRELLAQTQTPAQGPLANLRRPDRYEENFYIFNRKPFTWPGGNRIAVWLIPNVEVFVLNHAAGTPNAGIGADVLNYSWREYGMRVGLWRMADAMDSVGARGTVALNASTCELFPKTIEEMKKRGWEMMGHNITNSQTLRGVSFEQEQRIIRTTVAIIERAMGTPVRGWLGSGLAETFTTLDTLAEVGIRYTGDWNNDDLPYRMKVKTGEMYSLPYGNLINDISYFGRGHTGEEYYQMLVDHFDTLYAESQRLPRIMGIPLHPFHTGQASNARPFQRALQHIKQREGVWFATGSEILEAYKRVEA